MSKLYETQWAATKAALCEGRDLTHNFDGSINTTKKQMLSTVLENYKKFGTTLMENAAFGSTMSSNVATLNHIMLPIIRRVMPTVIANEIFGVQPMTGPVGQVSTLRVRYSNTIPSDGSGVTAGSEALSPFDIARYYSGNNNPASPGAANTAALEGTLGNKISLQVIKEMVEAKTRRLNATWTFEAAQDGQSQYGIDIEAELLAAVAQEIVAEIDQELLATAYALPGAPTSIFDQANVTGTPTYVGDVHAALSLMILRQANLIASRTRRGPANWVVVSPTALTILQSAGTSAFARTTEGVFEAPVNTKFVGTLNNTMRVYVNQYAFDNTPVLVGYKGNESDAPLYYCPYIPLYSTGTFIDPQTGQPLMIMMSRYGVLTFTNTASSFGNSADYLGLVGINANNLTFM